MGHCPSSSILQWMEEILHQLVDGLSDKHPIIYRVSLVPNSSQLVQDFFHLQYVRVSQVTSEYLYIHIYIYSEYIYIYHYISIVRRGYKPTVQCQNCIVPKNGFGK